MSKLTRAEFYEKYKDVRFTFETYSKYTFTFIGHYKGKVVTIGVGGQSDEIYSFEVAVGFEESILDLQPYEGLCGEDSFYDF